MYSSYGFNGKILATVRQLEQKLGVAPNNMFNGGQSGELVFE